MDNMNAAATYLITPTHLLKSFLLASDREYFSKPVRVEALYSERTTRHLFVRDLTRGNIYPTNAHWVAAQWRLTNRQRKEAA